MKSVSALNNEYEINNKILSWRKTHKKIMKYVCELNNEPEVIMKESRGKRSNEWKEKY